MPVKKQIIDSIRVKILSAMTKKRSISPNIKQIQKYTGFHRSTIKASINFLEENNFINGYRPLLNADKAGYKLRTNTYFQIDISDKQKFKDFINVVNNDQNIINCSQVISDDYTNVSLSYISKDVEDYYSNIQEKYYLNIPKVYDFLNKRTIYYLTNPYYKNNNEIDTIINLLKKERGID
jgi:DNA-binding Lrp family transcriptional regulator